MHRLRAYAYKIDYVNYYALWNVEKLIKPTDPATNPQILCRLSERAYKALQLSP